MDKFIQGIPKAELHVHIEGTFEPELIFALAKRNHIPLKYKTIAEVHAAYQFQDLQSFLNLYYENMQVLLHEQDFYDLASAYLLKASQQNIRHSEIFFDPQAHLQRGVAFAKVINGLHRALIDAEKKRGITSKLIMCFLRDLSEEDAIKTFKLALPFKDWIVAVGLDSAEKNNPPRKFKKVYEMARHEGFLAVAHAGEESSPEYIWETLDILKVSRIDHGVRCLEDPKLVERLVKEAIPLTVCPLSNVKLCICETMQEHVIKKMLELNLHVTINSDDPAYFNGYINDNILAVQQALGLDHAQIYQLEKNAFLGSFISEKEKQKYLQELDQFFQQNKS